MIDLTTVNENLYIYSSNNDWGYSKIYKIKEGDNEKDKRGKNKTKEFKLGKGHKLEGAYCQKLLSKQSIVLHAGYFHRIPDPCDVYSEEEKKTWQKKADKFGAYMLMAFCPEINNYDDEHRDDDLKYDWRTFLDWINELEEKLDINETVVCIGANKSDLEDKIAVSNEEVKEL